MREMKQIKKLQDMLRGLTDAFGRYPLTALFLFAAAAVNAADIITGADYSKYLMVFAVGAFLSVVMQAAYERFFYKAAGRWALMAAAVILTAGYYLVVMPAPELGIETGVRTSVAMLALFVAFIWVPSVRSSISFNESFMIAFKAFFNALLFSGVIMAGIGIIIAAADQLLFQVHEDAYSHTANIVFILFAPMYFLSLVPVYPGEADKGKEQEYLDLKAEKVNRAAYCPRFLEILISYVIIPLLSVFTIILVLYILRNIGGRFWTDNLLEPMLVSYSITVILLYILASRLENRFALYFRLIFPKVLVPIVIFQIIASVLSLGDTGFTHTRYYVILFGIFAAASGIVLSVVPVRKNGIVAAILVVFAVISIIPPVDAFTVSRASQTARLEKVLLKNNMLAGNSIKPNADISEEDKEAIVKAFDYLRRMDYTGKLDWLPADTDGYRDFSSIFGFNEYDISGNQSENVYLVLEQQMPVDIKGYDTLVNINVNIPGGKTTEKLLELEKQGVKYTLSKYTEEEQCDIILSEDENRELIRFSTQEMLDRLSGYSSGKGSIAPGEATFSTENEAAKIRVIVRNANIDKGQDRIACYAELYVLVTIK